MLFCRALILDEAEEDDAIDTLQDCALVMQTGVGMAAGLTLDMANEDEVTDQLFAAAVTILANDEHKAITSTIAYAPTTQAGVGVHATQCYEVLRFSAAEVRALVLAPRMPRVCRLGGHDAEEALIVLLRPADGRRQYRQPSCARGQRAVRLFQWCVGLFGQVRDGTNPACVCLPAGMVCWLIVNHGWLVDRSEYIYF